MTSGSDRAAWRWPEIAFLVLLLMGLTALVATVFTVNGYVRAVKSTGQLDLQIRELRFVDDDNPRIHVRFHLTNRSPLSMVVESYVFQLYLYDEWIGGSNSTYMGTDPSVDPATRRNAVVIGETLLPERHLDLDVTLYVYVVQQEAIRQAQQSGSAAWTARTAFQVLLPNAREQNLVQITTLYEE